MRILETERLIIRHLTPDDADFILELLNEPPFIRFIGDRGVRNTDDARNYIANVEDSYAKNGFGLFLVELKDTGVPIGMCGLLKRDSLEDVDIGYAYLQRYWSKGYGYEAAAAVMNYGRNVLKIPRIIAITSSDNESSGRLLEKIGLRFEKLIRLPGDTEDTKLFTPADERQ